MMEIQTIFHQQQDFFLSNATKDINLRIEQLKKFKAVLQANEALLYQAIDSDFGKSEFDTYTSELSLIYHEIAYAIKHIKKWSKSKRVSTGLVNFPAKSYIIPEPLGVTLVIGAWNYPYQLSLIPAISALAAGNTVIIKPSELPAHTSAAMAQIINQNFSANYFHVVEGGVETTSELLKLKFDKIFFTGSTAVGKIIYQAAAQHLTPVTLELGGKSPTFILADCDIQMTAKRVAWSKFLNAGQTCVAPDYLLVEQSVEEVFLSALKAEIKAFYPQEGALTENYVRIINQHHFERLQKLLIPEKTYLGGQTNPEKRIIYPTLLKDVSFEDAIMEEEIFGPILPVLSFNNLDEVIRKIKEKPKPLACYIYSKNRNIIEKILREVSFGGGGVNESVMHLTNSQLPFGGIGSSGMGSYHGRFGFETFSHYKSILDKPLWFEANIKYAPYSSLKLKLIKWLMG